jgi:peptidase M28-like protein
MASRQSNCWNCLPVFVLLLAGPICHGQRTQDQLVTRDILKTRLGEFVGNDSQREATLKKLFQESGCADANLSEQTVKHLKEPNLICSEPGENDSVIIVGAHFDHVKTGEGVVDNWSGASLLPSLLFSMRAHPLHHSFLFIAFAGEEQGLVGSRYYASQLAPAQRSRIKAVIDIDTLGLTPTKVWGSHADWDLFKILERAAYRLDLPLEGVNVDGVGSADSESFARLGIPTILIHSITQETWGILHTKRDRPEAINFDYYYDSYRLISAYLKAVDDVGANGNGH